MIVAVLFCIGDLDAALTTSTGYPFVEIFLKATNSVSGAATMASIVTILALCAIVGCLASASRMLWSFARDQGVPGWRTLRRVGILSHLNNRDFADTAWSIHLARSTYYNATMVHRRDDSHLMPACIDQHWFRNRLQ